MPPALLLTVVFVSVVVFVAVGRLTRAAGRAVVAALFGGIVASAAGCALDVLGTRLGWWLYTAPGATHAPRLVYAGVAFLQGAVALIASRIATRFGAAIVALWVAVVAGGFTAQDFILSMLPNPVQVMTAGLVSLIGDFLLWSIVTTTGIVVMRLLAGEALQPRTA